MTFNKTDEELKRMTDEELFDYLDEKAANLAKHTSPLGSYHTKRYASLTSAITNTETDWESVKRIAKENEQKGFEKFIKEKNKEL
jgi:hypothetical protein